MLTLLIAFPAAAGGTTADLSVTKTDTPDPVTVGSNITYTITVQNGNGLTASNAGLTDPTPPGTTFVSMTAPAGWTVTTPPVGGTGNVTAVIASFPANTTAVFTLVLQVDPNAKPGIVTNTAAITSTTPDPNSGNNFAQAETTVNAAPPATPAASLSDAATSQPVSSPLAILGFAILLVAALSATAVLAVRPTRH
jgi:uncharacterized repeat protein (TIGR01451 family)